MDMLTTPTPEEAQENKIIKEWFKDIMPIANILNNFHGAWQVHSIEPREMLILIKTQQKKMFLALAEKMVETYGFKATLLLLAANFLDEQEKQPTIRRDDGLIDLPVR